MKKKIVIIASSALIVGGVGVTAYNLMNPETITQEEFTVEAKNGNIQVDISAMGIVSPTVTEDIVPNQSGVIKESFIEDGKFVKKGDLLVTFEGEDVEQDLTKIEANLEKLKIDLIQMEKSLEKYKENLSVLSTKSGILKEMVVNVGDVVKDGQVIAVIEAEGETKNIESKAAGEVSIIDTEVGEHITQGNKILTLKSNEEIENQIKKQNIDLESEQKNRTSLKEKGIVPDSIYAPFDGEIKLPSDVVVGSQIAINTVLGTITNYKQFNLLLTIDELDIPKVKIGQEVVIKAKAYPDQIFLGEVKKIASQGETTNGVSTFEVEVSIEDPKELKAGMTAIAKIVVSDKKQALLLPIESLEQKGNKNFVNVQTPEGHKEVEVITGLNNVNSIEIVSGLKEGQKVLLPITSVESEKTMLEAIGVQGGKR